MGFRQRGLRTCSCPSPQVFLTTQHLAIAMEYAAGRAATEWGVRCACACGALKSGS